CARNSLRAGTVVMLDSW
nr:immunoglobulin heavy chain junction region [Macaca mulatta]MOV47853.1 immunoglobulin heavy chain junction region [Macaca mulatta]MOV48295.1 immunoglobulin heavy chain junction region [Macaca mulatta]